MLIHTHTHTSLVNLLISPHFSHRKSTKTWLRPKSEVYCSYKHTPSFWIRRFNHSNPLSSLGIAANPTRWTNIMQRKQNINTIGKLLPLMRSTVRCRCIQWIDLFITIIYLFITIAYFLITIIYLLNRFVFDILYYEVSKLMTISGTSNRLKLITIKVRVN